MAYLGQWCWRSGYTLFCVVFCWTETPPKRIIHPSAAAPSILSATVNFPATSDIRTLGSTSMGNFEKVVVLVVLLASAGALAVSLNNSETKKETPSNQELVPAPGRKEIAGGAPKSMPQAQNNVAATKPKSTLPKLDAGFQQAEKPAAQPMAHENGMPYILVSKAGLKPANLSADYMTYEPVAGDSWLSLAQRFYANSGYANAIKMANEGVSRPDDVDLLMIPLYDFAMEQTQRPAYEPAPELSKAVYRNGQAGTVEAASQAKSVVLNPAGGITYEVISGDSLSLISQKVYGKASRWKEIFAANRDQLKDENSLKLGMKLYVPKAGEFKPADTKSNSKVH